MNSLKELYNKEISKNLKEKFNYSSIMEVPKLEKIVVNIGVGDGARDEKMIEAAVRDLEAITGQHPVVTKAKHSIAGFKLRGMDIVFVTTAKTNEEALELLKGFGIPFRK